MKYLSKVASLACIAGVAVSLVGCGSSSKPAAGTGDCPIPSSVKALNVTLDQNQTKSFLGISLGSVEFGGWMVQNIFNNTIDGLDIKKATLNEKDKKLATKVANMINYAKSLKQDPFGESELEVGDDIACENGGTYSLHYKFQQSDGMEDGVNVGRLHFDVNVKFKECKPDGGDPVYKLAMDVYKYNGFVNLLTENNAEDIEVLLKGESKANMDLVVKNKNIGSTDNDGNEEGVNYQFIDVNLSVVNNNINFSEEGDDYEVVLASNGKVNVSFDGEVDAKNKKVVEDDGNTTTNTFDLVYDVDMDMGFKESFNYTDTDDNESEGYELLALCFSSDYDGKWDGDYYEYRTNNSDDENKTIGKATINTTAYGNGYMSFYSYDEFDNNSSYFFDLYQNAHKVVSDFVGYRYDEKGIWDQNNSFSVNGTIGMSELGGSVKLHTVDNWLSSNHFLDTQNADIRRVHNFDPYFWIEELPYAGKTTMTSKNQATIGFDLNDDNETYGYIQIGDQDPVKYDSINDMREFED